MDRNSTITDAADLSQHDVNLTNVFLRKQDGNSTGINNSQQNATLISIDAIDALIPRSPEENKIPEPVYIALVSFFRIIFILGLFTNFVSLNALWKKAKKTSTEIFFIGISIADLIYLFSNSMLSILDLVSGAGYIQFTDGAVKVIIPGIMASFLITNLISAFLMSILSVERIFAVYKPLTFREMWTPKRAKIGFAIGFTLIPIVTTMGFVFAGPGLIASIQTLILLIFGAIVFVSNCLTLAGLKKRVKFARTINVTNTTATDRVRKQTHILLGISVFFLATLATRLVSIAVISTVAEPDMTDPHNKRNVGNFIVVNISELTQMCFCTFNSVIFVALNDRYSNSFGIRFLMRKLSSRKQSS